MKIHHAVTMAMGTNTHIFDCGRGYGETKSPSSCKAEKIPEGFLSDIAKLALRENAPARVNYPEALGLRHLAFKVKSVDDTAKELNAKGIATERIRLDDYTGKKMTFFHDPDGLPLEIHE